MDNVMNRISQIHVLTAILCFSVITTTFAESPPTGKLPSYVQPTHYRLELDINPHQDYFHGRSEIDIMLDKTVSAIWLHSRELVVDKAFMELPDGSRIEAEFKQVTKSGVANVKLNKAIGPGRATLVMKYSASFNQSLEGLYNVKRGHDAYAYTHFEPLRARRAFPGFDEPRFKTPYDISLTINDDDVAISNAPTLETVRLLNGRKTVRFQTTEPIPSYLVAMAVGDFDIVEWEPIPANGVRTRPLRLRGIAPKGKGGQFTYALKHTAKILEILEEYFDVPYPYAKLDLVAVEAFNPSGMENVGAIFYRQDKILLEPDPSVEQFRSFAFIHAHELAHNWFGNLVTPVWWDDLWLNEAFASWMANKVVHRWRPQDFNGRGAIRSADWARRSDQLSGARQIRQPIQSDSDIKHAFDAITYSKGSSVLSMFERYLGPDEFRRGVRRYINRHRHGVATAEDFFRTISESARNKKIVPAFRSFIEQPGIPQIAVEWSCEKGKNVTVSLKQSRALPLGTEGGAARRWIVPICLTYPKGTQTANHCTLLSKVTQTAKLPTNQCPGWIMPNSGGTGYLNFALPNSAWSQLIAAVNKLTPGEILTLVSSANAAYRAGLIDTARLLDMARAAAQSPYWDVVRAPMQGLREVKLFVIPTVKQEKFQKKMRAIYSPALAKFDLSDSALAQAPSLTDQAMLRRNLIWFLAIDANDEGLRRKLNRLGLAYLGDGDSDKLRPDLLHPNLVQAALIVATQEGNMRFVERLIQLLKRTKNTMLRRHIVRSLSAQTDPEKVARVWQLILDPKTRKWEASQLLRGQGYRVANRELVFDWLAENYDAVLNQIPASHRPWLVWRTSGFCDLQNRDRIEAFFKDRVKEHVGGPRALQNVLEKIEICSAVAAAQRPMAIQALQSMN
jgi:alanyl aminopeptidase